MKVTSLTLFAPMVQCLSNYSDDWKKAFRYTAEKTAGYSLSATVGPIPLQHYYQRH